MLVDGSYKSLLQGVSQQPARARIDGQCTLMDNMVADAVDGLRRRPPTSKAVMPSNIPWKATNLFYDYDTGKEQYVVVFEDTTVHVFDPITGAAKTVNNIGTAYLSLQPKIDLRLTTIGDYTVVANTTVNTALTADVHTAVPGALIYFRDGGEYGRKYEVFIAGVSVATFTTPGGDLPATQAEQTGTEYVATQIYNALVSWGGAGYTFTRLSNVILVTHTSITDIDITVSDDRGNLFAVIVQAEVEKTSELPLYALPGMVVTATGSGTNENDDLYMEAEILASGSGSGFQEVVWRESVQRNLKYKFDAATMPHALIRLSDGTFYFGPLNGGTYGGTVIERWLERDAGDETSNPVRAFIDNPIEFVTSFQERLVLLSGDFLIMSSTKSFFNFWNTTAVALLKSDPIELVNPATKATSLKVALQHSKNLVVFSSDTQFIVAGSSGITPETAAMSIATSFQAELTAVPIAAGSNVFFSITYGVYSGVREFFTDSITAAQDSRKITEHIKRYIPGTIDKMIVSSNLGLLLCTSNTHDTKLFNYQYLWDGENRLQSAWSRWNLDAIICHNFFIGSNLYLVLKNNTEYKLVKIDSSDSPETGLDFNIYLDNKEEVLPVAKQFTLPTNFDTSTLVVVQSDGANYPGMSMEVDTIVGSTVTLKVDPGGNVTYGNTYRSAWRPTMPLMKDSNGVAMTTDKLIINTFNIAYKDTGRFKVEVIDDFDANTTQEFSGRIVGAITNKVGEVNVSTGFFSAGVHKDRAYAEVEIYTESYLPMSLIDLEWTGQFTKRGRRF